MKLLHGAVVATAWAFAAGEAAASCQALQKKDPNLVCRLGAYAPARFYRPRVKTTADVAKMLETKKASVVALLADAPLLRPVSGADAEALYQAMLAAAKTGSIATVRVGGPGQPGILPFMAMRDWRTGKDKLKLPQKGGDALTWGGDPAGFETHVLSFTWDKHEWKLYVPAACGNFWLEATPIPDPPVVPKVKVSSGDVCLGQPVPLSVRVEDAVKIELTVDGQTRSVASAAALPSTLGTLSLGEHSISVKVTSKDDKTATDSARAVVKSCPPTCDAVTVTPARIRLRNTVDVGARASVNPAYGGSQSIQKIAVTISGPAGAQMSFDGASGSQNWKPTAIGDYSITAVATDSLGQQSAACTATPLRVDRPAVVAFGAGLFGKERLVQEEEVGARVLETGRCAALLGVKAGALFALGETGDFEIAAGGKINLEEGENSSIFIDAALQRLIGRGFIGGGLSAWDLTESDTRSVGALIQGGFDLDPKGKVQFVIEGRLPFNTLDDVENNYQFWGGIRFRPAQR